MLSAGGLQGSSAGRFLPHPSAVTLEVRKGLLWVISSHHNSRFLKGWYVEVKQPFVSSPGGRLDSAKSRRQAATRRRFFLTPREETRTSLGCAASDDSHDSTRTNRCNRQ